MSIIVDNVSYNSPYAVAKAYGLKTETIQNRLNKGLCGDDLVGKNVLRARQITVHGITYNSIKELADAFDLPRNTIQERLKRGITDDDELIAPRKHLSRLRNKSKEPAKSPTVKSIDDLLMEDMG